MLINCYTWEHTKSYPFSLVLCLHFQCPSAQSHQTSSSREITGCQRGWASQALCWVGYGVQGGSGSIPFSLCLGLFFKCSLTCLPLTGFQLHLDAAPQPPPALGDTTGNCLSHSDWFVQLHPSAAVTEVWLRSRNGPVATRSLLEQAGASSGPGKPSRALSTGQLDTCCRLIIMWQRSYPLGYIWLQKHT